MDRIKPSRGLRQGNQLSPYIFGLCMEQSSHWIRSKVENGTWRPLRASRGGVKVSHLFFADDLILFAQAGDDQNACIKDGQESFSRALGLRINFDKSLMFFSPNILEQEAARLSASMGIPKTTELGQYLGYQIVK